MKSTLRSFALLLLVSSTVFLSSCKNRGAKTIPDLAALVYDALKSGSIDKFDKTLPERSALEKYYYTYVVPASYSEEQKKEVSENKSIATLIAIRTQFENIVEAAKTSGSDLSKMKFVSQQSSVRTSTNSLQESIVTVILQVNSNFLKATFDAVEYDGRWYVIKDLTLSK